jgi:hypothetical protein
MANAPLVGQDGGSCAFDLPDEASDLFLAATLDEANHIEIAEEISVSAQARNWPRRAVCRVAKAKRAHHLRR